MSDKIPDSPIVDPEPGKKPTRSVIVRFLDGLEWLGNKLPDPAVLFVIGLLVVWVLSFFMSGVKYTETLPGATEPIQIINLLSLDQFAQFLAHMVENFVGFHPLGVVLVAMLGVGVAEHSGFINACLKNMLHITPGLLLTPMLLLVAIVSHTAADAGYVLVIPIGGVMFYAAGRHPLAGIACAFAGVSGGFSANFIPSGIDPLLSGLTQTGVDVIPGIEHAVNPLCNWLFTGISSLLIIGVGWFLTDVIVEPRLRNTEIDGDPEEMPPMDTLSKRDQFAMWCALGALALCVLLLVVWAWFGTALRNSEGKLDSLSRDDPSPIMQAIVPLIFLLFLVPGVVHGYVSGRFTNHRDVIKGMTKSMEAMGYYLVLVFFAALFIASFTESNIGTLIAVKGANFLRDANLPAPLTIVGIILLAALVNLLIGSASAKWAMLAPIFVPMLMLIGISPELTQAAYRVGDSSTNIITPMMPYFPLVVVFCQRYVKNTGIGTVGAMMLPYSVVILVTWTIFLLIYWQIGIPRGIGADYTIDVEALQSANE